MTIPEYIRARIEELESLVRRALSAAAAASTAVQHGTTTLVNGLSPVIPANITPTSSIVVSLKNAAGGGAGNTVEYSPFAAARVVGMPGSFQIEALLAGGGGNVGDASDIDWIIVG